MQSHPQLLIGLEQSDDAAVYQISDDLALIQTVDFFPPIVDDAYTFGAIAAANALSDVYAMGGTPMLAMAIAAFPRDLPEDIITAIMQGGVDKVEEAGAIVCGGHTVVDAEPKYGLCVTGQVRPDQLTPKGSAQVGDVILLTKPLGTGIITTAYKRDQAAEEDLNAAIDSMLQLNRVAAEQARLVAVHGATDITGFGLAGHAAEIARHSGVGMRFRVADLPLLPGIRGYIEQGAMPGGLTANQAFLADSVMIEPQVDTLCVPIIFDPQTSGGLLVVLPAPAATELMQLYSAVGQVCWQVGEVVPGSLLTFV